MPTGPADNPLLPALPRTCTCTGRCADVPTHAACHGWCGCRAQPAVCRRRRCSHPWLWSGLGTLTTAPRRKSSLAFSSCPYIPAAAATSAPAPPLPHDVTAGRAFTAAHTPMRTRTLLPRFRRLHHGCHHLGATTHPASHTRSASPSWHARTRNATPRLPARSPCTRQHRIQTHVPPSRTLVRCAQPGLASSES